jgi:TatD DNase family protein
LEIVKDRDIQRGAPLFLGNMEMAEQVMSLGFYISVAGPVTFRKAKELREIAAKIPDDYLLIETDAPYLSPEPFRGKRNEPSYIMHTLQQVADLRGVSLEDMARITTLNAKRLFGIGTISGQAEIAYKIRDSLYLNITNRCTNKCSFCVKFRSDFVKGHRLRLAHEPSGKKSETRSVIRKGSGKLCSAATGTAAAARYGHKCFQVGKGARRPCEDQYQRACKSYP